MTILLFLYYHFYTFLILTDEKEKYDPNGFRDLVVKGLNAAGTDLEQVSKFLDAPGPKLDYKRYWEELFDILFAGGILGRSISALNVSLFKTLWTWQ